MMNDFQKDEYLYSQYTLAEKAVKIAYLKQQLHNINSITRLQNYVKVTGSKLTLEQLIQFNNLLQMRDAYFPEAQNVEGDLLFNEVTKEAVKEIMMEQNRW